MKKIIYQIVITAIIGLCVIAPIATFATYYTNSQDDNSTNLENKILQTIDDDNMYENIKSLSKKPRVAGSEQEDEAVSFIEKQFESYGYETKVQPFSFNSYIAPHTIELTLDGFIHIVDPSALEYSVSGHVVGEVVTAGLGKVKELQPLDLTGKIVLLKRGEISFKEKMLNAAKKGAAGVIFYNNAPGTIMGSLGEANGSFVPSVLLTQAEGEKLVKQVKNNPATHASLTIEGANSSTKVSHNVIATKKPSNHNSSIKAEHDIIVISAHHDSVAGAPGANDNASGTAMTLELARVLKTITSDTEIRFITFGAEEVGLLGSNYYVNHLSANEIDRIIANFNLDMVGSKDAGQLNLQTIDDKSNLVTELTKVASTKLNGKPTPVNQGDRSDHVPFAKAGIPAALFIHNPAEPWYHKPEDKIDKISKAKLQDVAEIVTLAIMNQTRIEHFAK